MRLPPLTALRAFEAAGRKLSFTLAATELGVTPGAVSRQIRLLEDYLGAQLFVRANREVSLTPTGAEYLEHLSEVFLRIGAATERIMAVPEHAALRVSTSATFTLRWLMPRLISYYALNPGNNLQLTMDLAPVNFLRDPLDATIKLGHEHTPQAVVRKLFRADLVAICSPRLLAEGRPLKDISDLKNHTLLHTTARSANWDVWLAEAGHPDIKGANRLDFDSSSLAYQAAIEGVGVAIAQIPLILEDLKNKTLVMPFPVVARDKDDYNLIWPDRAPRNRGLQRFRDWIFSQARITAGEVDEVLAGIAAAREASTAFHG